MNKLRPVLRCGIHDAKSQSLLRMRVPNGMKNKASGQNGFAVDL